MTEEDLQVIEDNALYNHYKQQVESMDRQALFNSYAKTTKAICTNPSIITDITTEKLDSIKEEYEKYKEDCMRLKVWCLTIEQYLFKKENFLLCHDPQLDFRVLEDRPYTIYHLKTAKYLEGGKQQILNEIYANKT